MLPSPNFVNEYVEARASSVHGFGLFAKTDIPVNWRICDYIGERMFYSEYRQRYPVPLDRYFYRGRNIWIMVSDKEPYLSSNPVNYINEGIANTRLANRGLYALKPLKAGDELYLAYPKNYKRTWADPNRSHLE